MDPINTTIQNCKCNAGYLIVKKFYPVLELSIESKLVFRFPIWDFISLEPINRCLQISRLKFSHIIDTCDQSRKDQIKNRIKWNVMNGIMGKKTVHNR